MKDVQRWCGECGKPIQPGYAHGSIQCAENLRAEVASLKTSQELLQKAVVDAYEVINHIIELDMLTPGGSTVGWACSVRSDLLQALPPAKRAELD